VAIGKQMRTITKTVGHIIPSIGFIYFGITTAVKNDDDNDCMTSKGEKPKKTDDEV